VSFLSPITNIAWANIPFSLSSSTDLLHPQATISFLKVCRVESQGVSTPIITHSRPVLCRRGSFSWILITSSHRNWVNHIKSSPRFSLRSSSANPFALSAPKLSSVNQRNLLSKICYSRVRTRLQSFRCLCSPCSFPVRPLVQNVHLWGQPLAPSMRAYGVFSTTHSGEVIVFESSFTKWYLDTGGREDLRLGAC